MTEYRNEESLNFRISAAKKAADRVHPVHEANGDEQRYRPTNYAMSFTKGLDHEENTGLIVDSNDFVSFRAAIDEGYVDAFTTSVRSSSQKERQWEAPTAGLVYDLQGPDSQAVTMAPAPALGSTELAYEMAEVYELALLRDTPLTEFSVGTTNAGIVSATTNLNAIGYDITGTNGRPRKHDDNTGNVSAQELFRGSSPGVEIGPYLSQFMLLGTTDQTGTSSITDGKITYGALQIDQRVPVAHSIDYMTDWAEWLAVQNGADTQDNAALFDASVPRRFITFPRDLATYVHYDALYEAYLNACLILLEMGAPTDQGFAKLSGQGRLFLNSLDPESDFLTNFYETHEREAGGFALWGGPHILTLVTEVATRALKAVRYQKFNNHCRLRPEALAARIEKATAIESAYGAVNGAFSTLTGTIQDTVDAIIANNSTNTALLPMAFQEGSPMHPSYGAGHATVAGACITMLKAYFDTSAVLVDRGGEVKFDHFQNGDTAIEFTPNATGSVLVPSTGNDFLTLEGELNKLAANISIARNMAGVHYFSDYYDSLRMGEEIALGILEEQALSYKTDPFVLSVQTFDGQVRSIGKR